MSHPQRVRQPRDAKQISDHNTFVASVGWTRPDERPRDALLAPVALTSVPQRLLCLVLPRLSKAALVLALAWSIGLHWAFFQSLAWVGMVLSYSQDATLTEALAKTFDGKHPCHLCKQIAKGKQSEKKSDLRPEWKKFEFSYALTSFVFSHPTCFWKFRPAEQPIELLAYAPPVPPPRAQA